MVYYNPEVYYNKGVASLLKHAPEASVPAPPAPASKPQAPEGDIPSAASVAAKLQEERKRKEAEEAKRVAEARYRAVRTSYLEDFNHQLEVRPGQVAKLAVNDKESSKRFQQELEAKGWQLLTTWESPGLPLVLALIVSLPEGR